MMYFAAIEAAALAHIKAASEADVLGYRLRQVDSYSGQLGEQPDQVIALPAVWGCFLNARQVGGKWTARFAFMCASRNARNDRAARHGVEGEVGAYQIAKDVAALLDGNTFGVEDIESLNIDSVRLIVNGRGTRQKLAVLAVEATAVWVHTTPGNPFIVETTDDGPAVDTLSVSEFHTFHADWDVPVFIEPPPETIPLTEGGDANDLVTLAGSDG